MRTRIVMTLFIWSIAIANLIALTGCDSSDSPASDTSTVQGNVSRVVTARGDENVQTRQAKLWWQFFSLVRTAHAQGGDLSGIVVTAILDGEVVDETTTDSTGQFTLNVPGGDLVIKFVTDSFEATMALTVPKDTALTLTVSLQPNDTEEPVVIEHMDVVHKPIRCTSDTVVLEGSEDIKIDGGGHACIHANGNCSIHTAFSEPADILLTNCSDCIRAEGNADVDLITLGAIHCEDALENGLWTRGKASVSLDAGETVQVSATADGINAGGTSVVSLVAQGMMNEAEDVSDDDVTTDDQSQPILIDVAGSTGIRVAGAAMVQLDSPGMCAVDGTEAQMHQNGNANVVMTCAGDE